MSGHLLSHSNSFGFEMEKDAAGCRALNRNYYCRRRASHIQDVRQNTESGMSLDELSQNPVLDDTIRSYYNNPVQVAQVGSYYVFQSDGRHRTLAAQSLDTYIPVLVTGSYTRND